MQLDGFPMLDSITIPCLQFWAQIPSIQVYRMMNTKPENCFCSCLYILLRAIKPTNS